MRIPTKIAGLALAVLLLSGCLPQQPTATDPPEASSAPVFDSEEEALAAATAAYTAYSAVSDQIGTDGGEKPDRLRAVVTSAWFEKDLAQFTEFSKTGRHLVGQTTFDSIAVQSFDEQLLAVYLCIDVSGIRVLDSSGTDVTPLDRVARVPLEVGFDLVEAPGSVLLASSQVWDGDSFCDG